MKKLFSSILALALLLSVFVGTAVFASATEGNAAKIGDTEYATLEEAIKAAPKNTPTTIYLLKNYTIKSTMAGHQYVQNITVDLGGHTLTSSGIALTAYRSGTTLTIKNGTVSGNSTSGTLRATYGGKIILGEGLTIKGAGGSATLVYVDNGTVEFAAESGVNYVGGKQNLKLSANENNKIIAAASIGEAGDGCYYGSLSDAVAAAKNGDTITLLKDITMDNTVLTIDKNITIDFNGNTVTGKFGKSTSNTEVNGSLASAVAQFVLIENANVTLKDSVGTGGLKADAAEYGNLSNLIRVATTGELTIEGGNYHQNLSVVGAGMIDSRGSDNITVKGGNFKLGNVGTESNGSPWIFNTSGRNSGHINVVGGTFNADVFHQYYVFEVQVPDDKQGILALSYDEETNTYTVVNAVAYVVEKHGNYEMKVGYATLEEALAACNVEDEKVAYRKGTYYASRKSEGETIVLLKDITLPEDTTIVINETITLDLNDKTIYGENTRTNTHNFLIDVKGGTLTASNGTIAMKHTGTNMAWNGATTVIDVTAGGVLNLKGVTVQNQGGTDMNFAVHMNNWGEVTLNADNCVFDATYCGVRVFNSGYDMNNVKITNSKLTGATRAFWVHNYLGDLVSSQHSDEAIKARLNLDIYGNNNNTFEITGTAKAPIRYGFNNTVYFNADGSQVVDSAE